MRDETVKLALAPAGDATERPISLAIVAMGGQGGGVLTGWIVKLAEDAGWIAQSTSVPGVAQRTGATIYYVEMMRPQDGKSPILAQMPTPGDVDVVIASEFIEAGRSILRGIVTPDRTTLIASSHRSFAISEKSAPGEGIADSDAVLDAIGITAQKSIIYDMNALAVANGSVISSAMFGALAASGALPFAIEDYHAVISAGGKGVASSLRTFDAAYARSTVPTPGDAPTADGGAASAAPLPPTSAPAPAPTPARAISPRARPLVERMESSLPPQVVTMARLGLAKVVDFQDADYGAEYLDLVEDLLQLDRQLDGEAHDFELTATGAKYLANAMAYDDVVRVADLKTRSTRRDRIVQEIGVKDEHVFQTTEYMHPRLEEVLGLMPVRLGNWLQRRKGLYGWLDRRISKGRRIRTYSLGGFLMLYVVGGMRGMRRSSLRHRQEVEHRDGWLMLARAMAGRNYALGVETLKCRRLIKGYSDTHARGLSKFDRVTQEIERIADRDDAAQWAERLRMTAIREAEGGDLDGLIRTIRSF